MIDTLNQIEDAPAAALSPLLQSIARNYVATRARAGEAMLESARYLAEARAAANYGEWGTFLEATGTTEDTASRMLGIARRASADRQYAAAISDGRLAFTAAFELLNAPAETQQRALESETPTPASTIKAEKQAAKVRTNAEFPSAAPYAALDQKVKSMQADGQMLLDSADEQHRTTIEAILIEAADKGERTGTRLYQQAYDHAAEIHDLALHNKMIAVIDRATDTPPPPRPATAPTLADLDAQGLPADLVKAGYYWASATPQPTIAQNNSNRRWDAPTPEGAIESVRDREKADAKVAARLPAPIYVKVMDLIGKLSQAVVDAENSHAAKLARAIAILIEQNTTLEATE